MLCVLSIHACVKYKKIIQKIILVETRVSRVKFDLSVHFELSGFELIRDNCASMRACNALNTKA